MLTALVLATWCMSVAGAHATAWFRSMRARPSPPLPSSGPSPRALLLRPLSGAEPALRGCLGRTGGIDSVVFCVGTEEDGAFPTAVAAARELARTGIVARVSCTAASGPNHKVGQLAVALEQEITPTEIVVVCDSDVRIQASAMDAARRRFLDPTLGVLWFAPVAVASRSWGDRCAQSVLSGSLHALPLLACIDDAGVVGKLLLVRRRVLESMGGFASLRHHLGEDMELGRRARLAGWRIERAEVPVRAVGRGVSFGSTIQRFARWVAVIRNQRPALLVSYPLLLGATTPALLVTLGAASRWPWLVAPAALMLIARFLVWRRARALARLGRTFPAFGFDVMMADLVLWLAFVSALGSRSLRWGGRSIAIRAARGLQS